MNIAYSVDCDVLVIGGGGAGIKAAISAADAGASVLLVTKRSFGTTGSTFYPGTSGWGMNAIIFPGDSIEQYIQEILEAGAGCADPELARVLATDCTQRFHELESYGIEFLKDGEGHYHGVIPCFGKRLRGSATYGIPAIRRALWRQLMTRGITVRDHVEVLTLVMDAGRCAGAVALDETEQLVLIRSRSTVLATGGACGLFANSLATTDQTGDGHVLASEVGARLVNTEFIQFIPGITWPVKKMLFQEKNLDTFPRLTDGRGREFLHDYLPLGMSVEEVLVDRAKHGPFSTSTCGKYFDIALYEHWRKGMACQSGGIHLQYDPKVLTDTRWFITTWLAWMKSRGIDVVGNGFDMMCHAQGFNGGIRIDTGCRTGVDGLFAAGECAGGPHGADRLGGAAIAATQVFGAIAGEQSASDALQCRDSMVTRDEALNQLIDRFNNPAGTEPDIAAANKRIRDVCWDCLAITRSEKRCLQALDVFDEIENGFNPLSSDQFDGSLRKAAELRFSLRAGRALAQAIRSRPASIGPHCWME